MININTDELERSVQIAHRANESITEVAQLLSSVTEHQDWVCEAKDVINENIRWFKSLSLALQEDANSYYTAIINTTNRFLETERNMVSKTNEVDDIISFFLSKVPSGGGGHALSGSSAKQQMAAKSGGGHVFGNTISFRDLADSLHNDGGASLLRNK